MENENRARVKPCTWLCSVLNLFKTAKIAICEKCTCSILRFFPLLLFAKYMCLWCVEMYNGEMLSGCIYQTIFGAKENKTTSYNRMQSDNDVLETRFQCCRFSWINSFVRMWACCQFARSTSHVAYRHFCRTVSIYPEIVPVISDKITLSHLLLFLSQNFLHSVFVSGLMVWFALPICIQSIFFPRKTNWNPYRIHNLLIHYI